MFIIYIMFLTGIKMFDQEQENHFPYSIKFILMMKIKIKAAMIRTRTLNDDHALPFQARPRLLFIIYIIIEVEKKKDPTTSPI